MGRPRILLVLCLTFGLGAVLGADPAGAQDADPLFDEVGYRLYDVTLTVSGSPDYPLGDAPDFRSVVAGESVVGTLRIECAANSCTADFATDDTSELALAAGLILDEIGAAHTPAELDGAQLTAHSEVPIDICVEVHDFALTMTESDLVGTAQRWTECVGGVSLTFSIAGVDVTPAGSGPPSSPEEEAALDRPARHPHERAALGRSLRTVGEVSTDAGLVLTNLALAALMLLLVFPAELFNTTLEENYDEVVGWFRGPRRVLARLRGSGSGPGPATAFATVVIATAVLYGFLDPDIGFDQGSIALVIGIAASLAVSVLVPGTIGRRWVRARYGDGGSVRVFPAALVVAGLCVLVSRLVDFQPGYLYGIVAGVTFSATLSKADDGRLAARLGILGLTTSLAAWLAWIPVRELADDANAGFVVLVLDAFLAALFVGGLQGLAFGFLPLRFLPGAKVWAWSKPTWLALLGVGAFGLLHVLAHPSEGFDGSVITLVVLFVAFATASVAFWAYFRNRRPVGGKRTPAHERSTT